MKHQKKLQKIRLLALDVDGILTDNRVWLSDSGEWRRSFSIKDGYGLVRLREAGIGLAVLTGSKAQDIDLRVKNLGIKYYYPGSIHKHISLEKLLKESGLQEDQLAYMGDDFFDIPVLKRVGFSATVPEALPEVKKVVTHITKAKGGEGAVREVCEMLLKATGKSNLHD